MNLWVEIPHGEFLVRIDEPDLWRNVKIGLALRGCWWAERDVGTEQAELPDPLDFTEFMMIAATCPCDQHMDELARDMGFLSL